MAFTTIDDGFVCSLFSFSLLVILLDKSISTVSGLERVQATVASSLLFVDLVSALPTRSAMNERL